MFKKCASCNCELRLTAQPCYGQCSLTGDLFGPVCRACFCRMCNEKKLETLPLCDAYKLESALNLSIVVELEIQLKKCRNLREVNVFGGLICLAILLIILLVIVLT